ncbi:MAG: hypothetical protein ABSA07_10820 [Acidimicrobiales bacterium]
MTTFVDHLATSRFQATDRILDSGLVPVRISRGAPRWKLRYKLAGAVKSLAPSADLYARRGSSAFESDYMHQLDVLRVDDLSQEFRSISEGHGGAGLVFLCFEDLDVLGEGSCHRRMFARWWEARTGMPIPEL